MPLKQNHWLQREIRYTVQFQIHCYIYFWGHNESKLFLLLRYFLGFTAFDLVIFDVTPLPPILPRYLDVSQRESSIFSLQTGRDITMDWKQYGSLASEKDRVLHVQTNIPRQKNRADTIQSVLIVCLYRLQSRGTSVGQRY